MLSAWIAVFDGRARLDRPGLVQYRTQTEYSTSHRPSTRASRTKDAAATPAPRPIRVLRRFDASGRRAPPNTWMNTSFITWKFEVTHSSQTECYARISRKQCRERALTAAVGDGMARGEGSDARAAVAPSSPPPAPAAPCAGPLSFWEVVPELPDNVVNVKISHGVWGKCFW